MKFLMHRYLAKCYLGLALALLSLTGMTGQKAPSLPSGQEYLRAHFAYYAPDASHLLVTLCELKEGRCSPWRYHLAEKRWERIALTPYDPEWSLESATYSPDGKTIAVSVVKCLGDWRKLRCPLFEYKLALIDAATGALQILPSAQPSFMPSFTPDGKSLVYWGLGNATPSGSGQAVYASHNLFVLDLADQSRRRAIIVHSQRPLAPPKVLADGKTVTISGHDISGAVTYQGAILELGTLNGVQGYDDSVILGNVVTGEMRTLLPKGEPAWTAKVIYDVSPDGKWALYSEDDYSLRLFALQDPTQRKVLIPSPALSPKRIGHGSFAPDGHRFVYVFSGELAISSMQSNPDIEIIVTPTWSLN
jgi:Tol biopolymer transport system component